MELQGHWGRGILVGHNLDVCTSVALRRGLKGLIEFSACANTRRKPIVASKRLRQVGIVPLSKIVVFDVGILAEQSFNQVARIIKNEDDGLQSAPAELADLLGCQLMGASPVNSTTRRSGAATAAPKAAGVAYPIAPHNVWL